MTKADLAKARTLATGKQVKETQITQDEVAAMRRMLKADFEQADLNWSKWAPVP